HRGVRPSSDPPLPPKVGRRPVWSLALLCGDGFLSDVFVPGPGTPRTLAGNHLRGSYADLSGGTGALPAEDAGGTGCLAGVAAAGDGVGKAFPVGQTLGQ